ncbi:MAG: thiamine phosphate synthase [Syntrophus sp. (in: bacteria)]|nr:thiamine phosphate synthase [Syntrophus sp. (in: bacteria)]
MLRKTPFTRDLYVISDSVSILTRAVMDGAAIVQLRDKLSGELVVLEKAHEIIAYKKTIPFLFILNDDPLCAVKAGADGVHIGQDTSTEETRTIIGEEMILGKTTHNLEQGRQAIKEGADYISVGPVYATPTKPGRPAVGLTYVREASDKLDIPFVVIGGIDLSNIDEVLAAGARTVGIVRACTDARELLKLIKGNKA